MSDVIKEAECKDSNNLLVTHIFITQFHEKFDLRTTMLVRISHSIVVFVQYLIKLFVHKSISVRDISNESQTKVCSLVYVQKLTLVGQISRCSLIHCNRSTQT